MPTTAFAATLEHLSARLVDHRVTLAASWLEHLERMLPVDARDVFPTPTLLDHIPDLIAEMAMGLHGGDRVDPEANARLMDKAEQLGVLRFDQQASVGQLLREYEVFSEIIDGFLLREVAALGERADPAAAVLATTRMQQAVRALQQRTVDVLVARYARRVERQTTQLRTFSQLVSHEIRQPLGVLQVVSRMLRRPDERVDTMRMTQTLERNVVRLGEVADQLERLARLTRVHPPEGQPAEAVELRALVETVADRLRDVAEGRGVRVEIADALPTLPPGTDAGRVELVLTNLIGNAIKYADPGKPDRVVRVHADEDGRRALHVQDNGIGIPPAKLDLIFEHFVRVHADRDDETGARGMGLGLAIVRECVDAMGGDVRVASVDGEGSTFTVEWPAGRPPIDLID